MSLISLSVCSLSVKSIDFSNFDTSKAVTMADWFWNCEPTHGFTYQNDKKQKIIKKCKSGIKAGICSEERSLISSDYARNWICDFVIGKTQNIGQLYFDFGGEKCTEKHQRNYI